MASRGVPHFLTDQEEMKEFSTALISKVVEATKLSNGFPVDDDFQYYSTFSSFREKMENSSKKLLVCLNGLVKHQEGNGQDTFDLNGDAEDAVDRFGDLVDIVDMWMDKVDLYALQYEPAKLVSQSKITALPESMAVGSKTGGKRVFHGSNVVRPQLNFEDKIDNSPNPFVPKLASKPNAVVPLKDSLLQRSPSSAPLSAAMDSHLRNNLRLPSAVLEPSGSVGYPNPYTSEIENFSYTDKQLVMEKEQLYRDAKDTKLTFVDTEQGLTEMLHVLEGVDEIAIDLEQHGYRSYQGFVCLMQVSTRTEDFLVDTLSLRSKLQLLNIVFTDPTKVKVLHGCDSDVVWLQRDFGLYLVNVFDTGQASRMLEFPSFALAYLLKFYCDVQADKQYQLADWRIRPLPDEMIDYAREDTHYLLYIYDRMRKELIDRGNENKNLLTAVLDRSRELCKRAYEKPLCYSNSHIRLYQRQHFSFSEQQMKVFASIFRWRDSVAREEDESTRYVLPNHMMFRLAEMMPQDTQMIMSLCTPVAPPLIKLKALDLVRVIENACNNTEYPAPNDGMKAEDSLSTPPVQRNTAISSTTAALSGNAVAGWMSAEETSAESDFTGFREERKRLEVSLAPCPPSKRTFFDFSSDEDEDMSELREVMEDVRQSLAESFGGKFNVKAIEMFEEEPEKTQSGSKAITDSSSQPKAPLDTSEFPPSIMESHKRKKSTSAEDEPTRKFKKPKIDDTNAVPVHSRSAGNGDVKRKHKEESRAPLLTQTKKSAKKKPKVHSRYDAPDGFERFDYSKAEQHDYDANRSNSKPKDKKNKNGGKGRKRGSELNIHVPHKGKGRGPKGKQAQSASYQSGSSPTLKYGGGHYKR